MSRYQLDDGNMIVADQDFVDMHYPDAVLLPEPEPASPVDPAQWLIDVGPFFDRFGAAKLQVLASADATVRALVTDLQVRKWIDLQRPDVALGIDLLTTKSVGVTAALKDSILTTPVAAAENLALRKTYFS